MPVLVKLLEELRVVYGMPRMAGYSGAQPRRVLRILTAILLDLFMPGSNGQAPSNDRGFVQFWSLSARMRHHRTCSLARSGLADCDLSR